MAGPNPTFAQAFAQLALMTDVFNTLELNANSTSPNLLTEIDAVYTALDGVYTPSVAPILTQVRNAYSGILDRTFLQRAFRPFLLELGQTIDAPEMRGGRQPSNETLLFRLNQYMVDNSDSINSPENTIDTSFAAGGGNTGNGTFHRLTVDKDGNSLQGIGGDAKVFECIQDQNTGAREHGELFQYKTTAAERDNLQFIGSGVVGTLESLHALSGGILENPSFEDNGDTSDDSAPSSTTAVTGWSVGTASNIHMRTNSSFYLRGYPGAPSTLYGIEFQGDDTLIQVVQTRRPGTIFNPFVPWVLAVAWQRVASATGTLTIHLGGSSTNVDISTGTNSVWNRLALVGQGSWPEQFTEDGLDVKIDVASLATGTVAVDDVILAPMVQFERDSTWYAGIGMGTPWLKTDTMTLGSDAFGGTRGKLQYWLWQAFGVAGHLPVATGGGETVSDP